ncbi:pyruvate dehydrogenase complex dihydrolipoamide acetyltransferase [Thalassobaculum salexigens]|uniref:pyruvate dehydrogenase complex dihydrolipoamide acetyltransferase n=1 Tax=Thalassobaculum salexigens TaxID=455360 RepID=UPI00248E9F08|nr:pyruvate dehydrogenase complex dihydrolipoamide acetyltransferase [Thalassobaculum salexigens]
MPTPILMPALSPTMTEGNLAKWMVKEGDTVSPGDVIAEIETDKATMEVEAVDEGTIGKIVVSDGTEGVAVNAVIAYLLEEGESADDIPADGGEAAPAPKKEEAPKEEPKQEAKPEPKPAQQEKPAPAPAKSGGSGGRVFASPLAKRMAEQAGLDLNDVDGSGPNGRIVKADIEKAMEGGAPKKAAPQSAAPAQAPAAAAPAAQAPSPDVPGLPSYQEIPNTNMRKVIAKRLTESKQFAPHFYLTVDCEIDDLLKVRKDLNAKSDKYKLSVNDLVIRASAIALKQVPAANATWTEKAIRIYDQVDISVAVAIEGGLITPVIRDAGSKGLIEISAAMKDLAGRAREGKLSPEDYQGGTFSISNLGMFGIKDFAAVINPPQGAILAVGAGEQRPVVKDGALAVATVMSCTLSVDHRVVDGAVGAEFLAAFKKLIEDPLTMLL